MPSSPDVVVVGAGVVGAACAYHLAAAGVRVRLLDRSYVASGSSGACEGNVLAWDKELERELPLALRSAELWAAARRASCPTTSSTTARAASSWPRPRRSWSPPPSARGCSPGSAWAARCSTPTRCGARSRTPRTTCRAACSIPATRSSSRGSRPPRWSAPRSRAVPSSSPDDDDRADRARAAGRATGVETAHAARSTPAPSSSPPACGRRSCSAPCGLTVPVTPRKGQIVVLERSPVVLPPQAQRGRLRRRRRGRRRRAADRDGRRVHAVRHRAARLQPPARRLRPRRRHLRRRRDRPPRRPLLPGAARRPRAARLRRPAPADARPHPDHRPVRRGAEHLRRHRPRGRRHRPRPGHGRARRRLAHGRAARASRSPGSRRTASPPFQP